MVYMQVALSRQGKASGRLVVLVQALTTPTLVAAAAADSQPAGSFVQGTDVPAVIQVCTYSLTRHRSSLTILLQCCHKAVQSLCGFGAWVTGSAEWVLLIYCMTRL